MTPAAVAAHEALLDRLSSSLEGLTPREQLDVLESLGSDVDDQVAELEESMENELAEDEE